MKDAYSFEHGISSSSIHGYFPHKIINYINYLALREKKEIILLSEGQQKYKSLKFLMSEERGRSLQRGKYQRAI